MKSRYSILLLALGICASAAAQVQLDKPLQLTGAGADGKVTGIQSVTNPTDAASKAYVDGQIAASLPAASNMTHTLSSNKTTVTVPINGNTNHDVVTLSSGYTGGDPSTVSIKVTGVPAGVTWNLTPGGGFPSFNSALIFTASASAAPGSYPLTIASQGGVSNQSVNLTLVVAVSKRVFISSQTYNGNLGGLSGADSKCQTLATNAGLGGTWRAWLSTGGLNSPVQNASSRVTQISGPYIRVDGTIIATSWADLTDGSIMNPIARTETNGVVPSDCCSGSSVYPWTNTRGNGNAGTETNNTVRDCNAWTSTSFANGGYGGSMLTTIGRWTDYDDGTYSCTQLRRIYCFEL